MTARSETVAAPSPAFSARRFALVGGVYAGLAVALGAFGTHTLADHLTEARLATFETAVRYQMYHALVLLAMGLAGARADVGKTVVAPKWLMRAGWCFSLGVLVFSGSLYVLIATDIGLLGAVTPLGGVLLIGGWASLVYGVHRAKKEMGG